MRGGRPREGGRREEVGRRGRRGKGWRVRVSGVARGSSQRGSTEAEQFIYRCKFQGT